MLTQLNRWQKVTLRLFLHNFRIVAEQISHKTLTREKTNYIYLWAMKCEGVKAARNDKNSKSGNYVLLNSYGMCTELMFSM